MIRHRVTVEVRENHDGSFSIFTRTVPCIYNPDKHPALYAVAEAIAHLAAETVLEVGGREVHIHIENSSLTLRPRPEPSKPAAAAEISAAELFGRGKPKSKRRRQPAPREAAKETPCEALDFAEVK